MNAAMSNLLSKLTSDPNTAIVLIDDRPRGGKLHISTIQLAIENPQPLLQAENSPSELAHRSILKFTPKSSSSPNFKLKSQFNGSILKSTRKLRSATKKVHFKSPQIVDIPTIDKRMQIPMTAKLTIEQKRFKNYTPIRSRTIKIRNLSFTDSSDKKKKLKRVIESEKVEKVRGDLKLKAVSRIPRRVEVQKLPEGRISKLRSPKVNLRASTCLRSPGLVVKQENLLKAKGVKLNRRFELMMENLMKKGKNTRKTL